MLKIETTRFGTIEVDEKSTFKLPDGILGIPDATNYLLLEHDSEGTPFKWLQSMEKPDLAFIVMDPNLVVENYRVQFDQEMTEKLGVTEPTEAFAMMSIVNIPKDNPIGMTVNLRAPILVHVEKRVGWQVVLPNEEYPIRHALFPQEEQEATAEK